MTICALPKNLNLSYDWHSRVRMNIRTGNFQTFQKEYEEGEIDLTAYNKAAESIHIWCGEQELFIMCGELKPNFQDQRMRWYGEVSQNVRRMRKLGCVAVDPCFLSTFLFRSTSSFVSLSIPSNDIGMYARCLDTLWRVPMPVSLVKRKNFSAFVLNEKCEPLAYFWIGVYSQFSLWTFVSTHETLWDFQAHG